MSAVISRDVLSSCDDSYASAQASSALGVFDAYCALGVPAGLTTQQAVGGGGGDASGEHMYLCLENFSHPTGPSLRVPGV